MKTALVALVAAGLATSACQSATSTARLNRDPAHVAQLVAARQGAEVNRVCFTDQINSWSPLGDRSVLLRQGVNDWYKLDLTGNCRPDWAYNAIALRTRPAGSLCLTSGDDLETFESPIHGHCIIDAIHAWNDKASVAESKKPG